MGTLPHMALLPGGRPIKVATPRVLYPEECKSTGHRSIDHRSITQWTRRNLRMAGNRPLTTSQMGITQNFQVSQSLVTGHPATVIGLRKYQHRGSQYSPVIGQRITGHQNLYLPTFSETHAKAWSSLIIIINYPWNRTSVICLPTSVAQLDAPSNWRPGGRGSIPRRGRQHSSVEIDHEIFSTVIFSLSADSRRAVVSFWRKNVHNTG